MSTPREKLARSLEALRIIREEGVIAIRSAGLSREDRETLSRNGFLLEIRKGWYISANPDAPAGQSAAWHASYWPFCASYLAWRFGDRWCLSPEASLSLHSGNRSVPPQLVVRAPKGGNKPTAFPFNTSLFDIRAKLPTASETVTLEGLRLYSLPAALIEASPGFFLHNPDDARIALASIRDASEIGGLLVDGGRSSVAGRLAGAFRNIGAERIAEEILDAMRSAGYASRERNPFETEMGLPMRPESPYAGRIRLMWNRMRGPVMERFPPPSGIPRNIDAYLAQVQDAYVADAYHSLSIEGYRVSKELVARVRHREWNPEIHDQDRERSDALAALGYWRSYRKVLESLGKVLAGDNPGIVAEQDHGKWFREMFEPSVSAGISKRSDHAGYRNGPVYIRGSRHVPPPREAIIDAMQAIFELLAEETNPSVRVVLGHFFFVYVHPYMDGNGRIGRFLMNVMLGAGGYPWTIVPVESRRKYMTALEEASVRQDIAPFTEMLGALVRNALENTQANGLTD